MQSGCVLLVDRLTLLSRSFFRDIIKIIKIKIIITMQRPPRENSDTRAPMPRDHAAISVKALADAPNNFAKVLLVDRLIGTEQEASPVIVPRNT